MLLIFIFLSFFRVFALSQVYVEYFYLPGCLDCEKTDPIIEKIEEEYGDAVIVEWVDVSTRDGWERWKQYNFTEVPAVVVNHEYKIPKDEISYERLKEVIDVYLYGEEQEETSEDLNGIPLLLSFSLGLFSGFSPCLMAILTFILAYGASSHSVKESFLKVLSFSLGLLFSYMTIGTLLLLLTSSFDISPFQQALKWVIATIMILTGLSLIFPLNLNFTKPFIRRFAEKHSTKILGLFLLGTLFSLVKLPCSTPFLLILLANIVFQGDLMSIVSLTLFNLGLITPIFTVGLIGANSVETARKIKNYGKHVKIIGGAIMIAAAVLLIFP